MTNPTVKRSESYSRTRRDHALETAEDYVEAIAETIGSKGHCRAVDLAEQFGVSHVTVSKIVARLNQDGLVSVAPYQPIDLTSDGKAMATRVKKRHETVLQFLICLGVDMKTAIVDSEGIEHHVSGKTLAKMREFINEHGIQRQ